VRALALFWLSASAVICKSVWWVLIEAFAAITQLQAEEDIIDGGDRVKFID
jgi:type III secretory pathway component EscS